MKEKNYYQILGVAQDAEDFVIRAAYKALAQRYHPDKYQGSKDEAASKMHDINEAYETLSDTNKRSMYDAEIKDRASSSSEQDSNSQSREWDLAVQYHPDLAQSVELLKNFSDDIVQEFKGTVLQEKLFDNSGELAERMIQDFLEERFGTDRKVLKFARDLIQTGHKDAAKELNELVILFGDSMDFNKIYIAIQKKYRPEMYAQQLEEIRKKKIEEARVKEIDEAKRKKLSADKFIPFSEIEKTKYFSKAQTIESIKAGSILGQKYDNEWYIHIEELYKFKDRPSTNETESTSGFPIVTFVSVCVFFAIFIVIAQS